MSIVYITIGNSDNKLSQMEWGMFWAYVNSSIHSLVFPDEAVIYTLDDAKPGKIHGIWTSLGNSQYQNACWCIEIDDAQLPTLKEALRVYAKQFKQDSIALAIAETEFVKP